MFICFESGKIIPNDLELILNNKYYNNHRYM